MKFITHALTYRLYTRFTFLFTFVRDFDRSDWLFSIDVYWHQLFDTYNWIIRHLRNGICIFIEYTKWTILMVYVLMGGVNYRTFVPSQNFHEKNEGIAKTLIKCDGNLLVQLLIQKIHFWFERNIPHMTPKSAVLDPPPINMAYKIHHKIYQNSGITCYSVPTRL